MTPMAYLVKAAGSSPYQAKADRDFQPGKSPWGRLNLGGMRLGAGVFLGRARCFRSGSSWEGAGESHDRLRKMELREGASLGARGRLAQVFGNVRRS